MTCREPARPILTPEALAAATRLREARVAAGLSMHQLEMKAGVGLGLIGRYERGACTPYAKSQDKIAAALGLDASVLFAGVLRSPRRRRLGPRVQRRYKKGTGKGVAAGQSIRGWRVLMPFVGRKGPQRQWLLECIGCDAKQVRSAADIERRTMQIQPCEHPLVDEVTPFERDELCKELIAIVGPMPLHVIGAAIGVSPERVRQIEAQAIRKLRALPPEAMTKLREIWQHVESRPGNTRIEPEELRDEDTDTEMWRRAWRKFAKSRGIPEQRAYRLGPRPTGNARILPPDQDSDTEFASGGE